jgi:Xaa-Pro aminopeptidase
MRSVPGPGGDREFSERRRMSTGSGGRERRLSALRASLAASGLDGLLVTSLANVRYLTGFSGSSALLLVTDRDTTLITDFRYRTQVEAEAGDVATVVIEATSLWARLWMLLPQRPKVKRLAFESAHVTHADFQRLLDAGSRWEWKPSLNLIEALREQKDVEEVAHIRDAIRIAEVALEKAVAGVREGMSEFEIGGLLESQLRRAGSEAFPFETIVATGERSALPHARCSSRRVRSGEFLLVDFGAVSGGYCSDITRTFSVGGASAEMRAIYDIVREANATASAGVRAGMRGKDGDAMARGYIDRCGFWAEFGHSLGHGIGLEVHEAPRLSRTAESPMPAGAVVTIEPGIYRPGWGGVRIEDDVLLTPEGPVVLTSFPRELLELG